MKATKLPFLFLLLAVLMLPCRITPARAAEHNDVFVSIEARTENNSGPLTSVTQWQVIRFNAAFDLRGHDVRAGDTTVIQLPSLLRFFQHGRLSHHGFRRQKPDCHRND